MANEIASIMNFTVNPIYYPQRPNEVKYATCSSEKARKLLGYSTKTTLHDGLVNMVNYMYNEGPKNFNYNYEIEINNKNTPLTWSKRKI